MEFQRFNLHPHVAAGVKAAGYVKPTPIQKQAIPPVLQGQDVLGLAQTGTGKQRHLCCLFWSVCCKVLAAVFVHLS